MEWIKKEYDAREGGILIGLFSTCYLGYPFVDHRMDVFGGIAEHYAAGDDVPSPFERARPLAMSGAYAYIEIYSDGEVIPVRDDGSTGGSAWI